MGNMKTFLTVVIFLMFGMINTTDATNYFVSNAGNNNYTGLSSDKAFLTLQKTTEVVKAGDSVFVSDGNYSGFDLRDVFGTATKPIVYKAAGQNVVINLKGPRRDDGINIEGCDYIVIDGFTVKEITGAGNGIRFVLANHCTVRNSWCDHNAERGIFTGFTDDILIEHNRCSNSVDEHGIYVSNSSDRPIIRYNECWGNNATGIHLNGDVSMGGDGIISDARVYGNLLHDNKRAAGINMDGVENPVIYNNVIYNNHEAQGIALFQQDGAIVTHGAKIYNNTIVVPDDGRWGILMYNGAQVNTEIYNNIIISQHSWRGCISAENIVGLKSDYNILGNSLSNNGDGSSITLAQWKALGMDANSIQAVAFEDLFLNFGGNDFKLKESSPAINQGKGSLVISLVLKDFNSNLRPSGSEYDIGAFEYQIPSSNRSVRKGDINVHPNPAKNFLVVDNKKTATHYAIINTGGQVIQRGNFEYGNRIELLNIPRGIYVLKIFSAQQAENVKFVIEK
jgi:hypothetical protein